MKLGFKFILFMFCVVGLISCDTSKNTPVDELPENDSTGTGNTNLQNLPNEVLAPNILDIANKKIYKLGDTTTYAAIQFENTGGTSETCSVSSSLPLGLFVINENNTCVISGTPSQETELAIYTVTISNKDSSGLVRSDTATVPIVVVGSNGGKPYLDFSGTSSLQLRAGRPVVGLNFRNFGAIIDSCSVSPNTGNSQLLEMSPAGSNIGNGLSVGLTNDTCVITGTPSAEFSFTQYTVTATNASGSSSVTISLQAKYLEPSLQDISASTFVFTLGTNGIKVDGASSATLTEIVIENLSGVAPTSCTASPALPDGITTSVSNDTCIISGTPTRSAISAAVSYAITGANSHGSTTAIVASIKVESPVTDCCYGVLDGVTEDCFL